MIIKTSTRGRKPAQSALTSVKGVSIVRKPTVVETTQDIPFLPVEVPSAWVADFKARKAAHNPRAEWEALWS